MDDADLYPENLARAPNLFQRALRRWLIRLPPTWTPFSPADHEALAHEEQKSLKRLVEVGCIEARIRVAVTGDNPAKLLMMRVSGVNLGPLFRKLVNECVPEWKGREVSYVCEYEELRRTTEGGLAVERMQADDVVTRAAVLPWLESASVEPKGGVKSYGTMDGEHNLSDIPLGRDIPPGLIPALLRFEPADTADKTEPDAEPEAAAAPEPTGVYMLQVALIFNDDDNGLAKKTKDRWQKSRALKKLMPKPIGKDPRQPQRNLYEPSALVEALKKNGETFTMSEGTLIARLKDISHPAIP